MSSENEDEDEIVFDDVGLKVSFVSEEKANNYVIRTLEIEDLEVCSKSLVIVLAFAKDLHSMAMRNKIYKLTFNIDGKKNSF